MIFNLLRDVILSLFGLTAADFVPFLLITIIVILFIRR